MTKRESLATNYIFFRFPTLHALVLLPFLAGFLTSIYLGEILEPGEKLVFELIQDDQIQKINSFLLTSKITLIILLSFFVTFKWTMMKKDGSYGFWLTQLVSRKKYFIKSNSEFVLNSYLGVFIGILLILFLGGTQLPLTQIVFLFLLSLSSILQLVVIGILIGELVRDPELATVVYIVITGIIVFGLSNREAVLNQIFSPEQHYYGDYSATALVLSWCSVIVLYLSTYFLHQRSSIEI